MTIRHHSERKLRDNVLRRSVEAAKGNITREISHVRDKYGFGEARELALEQAEAAPDEAGGILREVQALTGEVIFMYERRGYDVRQVGEHFEEALRGIYDTDTPRDIVENFFSVVDKTWEALESSLTTQAEERAREKVEEPEGKESIHDRVTHEMQTVWAKKTEEIKLGSRLEDLRSGLGLRTLSALLTRYKTKDSRGSDQAMPKAYAWAERGYELTKKTIGNLALRDATTPKQEKSLTALGYVYSMKLGKDKLAGELEGENVLDLEYIREQGIEEVCRQLSPRLGPGIDLGDQEWVVVSKTADTLRNSWQGMKDIMLEET